MPLTWQTGYACSETSHPAIAGLPACSCRPAGRLDFQSYHAFGLVNWCAHAFGHAFRLV
jgi:hypothetical protein